MGVELRGGEMLVRLWTRLPQDERAGVLSPLPCEAAAACSLHPQGTQKALFFPYYWLIKPAKSEQTVEQ